MTDTSAARLTRLGVAARLGCSKSRVRQLEQAGKLHAHVDANGVHTFDASEVETLLRARATVPARGRMLDRGEIAARAFLAFDEGLQFREVVIALRQPPDVIDALRQEWKLETWEARDVRLVRERNAAIARQDREELERERARSQQMVDRLRESLRTARRSGPDSRPTMHDHPSGDEGEGHHG